MNKLLLSFMIVLFLIGGVSVCMAVYDGQGNDVVTGRNVGIGTTTPQGALVIVNGKVGIGTWAPAYMLDVVGDINASGTIVGTGIAYGWTHSGTVTKLTTGTDNVGIGTTTPGIALSVLGSLGIGTWTSSLGTALTVMNGNVGIGSVSPEFSLVVAGPVAIDASNDITSAPLITSQSNNGWKVCPFSNQCWGVSNNEVAIKTGGGNSFQIFGGTNPSAAGGGNQPDTNASIMFSGLGNGTTYFKGNVGIGTWLTGVNALGVIGNVGIGTFSNLTNVYNAAPSGGMIVQGNVGIGTITPQTNLAVMGSMGIGTWTIPAGVALNVLNGNVGIGTNSPQNKLVIMGGNVGIGTWAPANSLIIQGGNIGIGTAAANRAHLEIISTTFDINGLGTVMVASNLASSIIFNNTSPTGARWDLIAAMSGGSFSHLDFYNPVSGKTPIIISQLDGVGIGTWAPFNALEINAGISSDQSGIGIGTNGGSPYIATKAPFGGMIMEGNWGIGTYFTANKLDVDGSGAVGTYAGSKSAAANGLIVSGNMGIATYNPQAALTVLGNVGIGTWRADTGRLIVLGGNVGIGTRTPQTLLAVVGGNVGIGTWTAPHMLELGIDSAAKPGGGSWAATSDARLKANVVPIEDALAKISRLQGVRFQWINPALHGGVAESGGFLAQDVQKIFPEFVTQSPCQGADCALTDGGPVDNITLPFEFEAYVVEAIKERMEQNKKLKVRIEQLEKKIRLRHR